MMARLMGLSTLSPQELAEKLGAVEVIDVNPPRSWLQARIPDAIRLDHDRFGPEDLPPAKDTPLVFYCSNPMCRKAPLAARRARSMGYTDVAVLSAGITGWQRAGLATRSGA